MSVFEIQGPDGQIYEVEAPTAEAAARAFQTYGQAKQNINAIERLSELEANGTIRPSEAAVLQRLRADQSGDQTAIGQTEATYRGLQQGATFNLADEAGWLFGGAEKRDEMRAADAEAQAMYPAEFGRGKTAGAVVSGLATTPLVGPYISGAKSLPGVMGRSGLVGAGEGFLFGFGEGEGVEDRIGRGVRTGAISGALSTLAPPAVGLALKGGRAVVDALSGGVDAAINRGSQSRARRAIQQAMERAGKTPSDVLHSVNKAAALGQPEFRPMDAMGIAGQRLTSGIVRSGGDGAEEIAQFLRQRQADQGDRVGRFVGEAFGRETAQEATERLTSDRANAAATNYNAARGNAAPVDVGAAVAVIDDRISGLDPMSLAGDSIDARLRGFRARIVSEDGALSDFNRVLGVKQDVSDAIGAAVRAGRNNEARELTRLRNALDEALEDASPSYRQANDQFAQDSRVIDSVRTGERMISPTTRATDNVTAFNAMTPEEQAAARIGYGDRALARIESNPAPTADKSRSFRSTKAQTEADAMALDAPLFRGRIQREGDMWETQNRALGGSRTADNLQDVANVGPMANLLRAAREAGNFQIGNAAQSVGAAVGPYMTGRNEATRNLIAQMLMSAQARGVVEPIERSQAREILVRRILEGAARGAERGVTP